MKRLIYSENGRVIGDYPDAWEPPRGCDMDEGLRNGSMKYVESPPEQVRPITTLVDKIISDPKELAKLKAALAR